MPGGAFWESRIHPDDRSAHEAMIQNLLNGEEGDTTYRMLGVDGVTRFVRDRARPVRRVNGGLLVRGIISDVTQRQQADAQLAEASDRFARLLDVVGEHVYLAQALPDGSLCELFQGRARSGCSAERSRTRRWRIEMPRSIRRTAASMRRWSGPSQPARTPTPSTA